jgi:hypothetical protein
MKKKITLPKNFGKMKPPKPKALFAEWAKTIPKGTPMRCWQNADMFMIVTDPKDFMFKWKEEV